MNEYSELTDEERLAQALIGIEIDRYVHRELTPYGAEQVAARLLDVLPNFEVPESIELASKPRGASSASVPSELEKKLTDWFTASNRGVTVEEQVYSLMSLFASELESEWDAGYERAEADSDGTGFWSRRFRSNPHRGIK